MKTTHDIAEIVRRLAETAPSDATLVEELRREVGLMTEEQEKLLEGATAQAELVKRLDGQVYDLKNELSDAPGDVEESEQDIERLHTERDSALARVADLEREVREAGAAMAASGLTIAQAHEQLAAAKKRISDLEAALRIVHPEREAPEHGDDPPICSECGDEFMLDYGYDPTPECDSCAQSLLEDVRIAARAALSGSTGAAGTHAENPGVGTRDCNHRTCNQGDHAGDCGRCKEVPRG